VLVDITGLACRQAREPREKNLVSSVIGILLVILLVFIDWFIDSLHGGIIISFILLYLHPSVAKLFSVISFES
jgi:hypothetical protein